MTGEGAGGGAMRFDYDRSDIHESYSESRRLPERTLRLWLDAIAARVPAEGVRRVLDIGCGTGRFLGGLAERFGATVVGVDRSANMLAVAGRGVAALEGRDYVIPDDIKGLVHPTLRHRLPLAPGAEIEGIDVETVLQHIIEQVPVPR